MCVGGGGAEREMGVGVGRDGGRGAERDRSRRPERGGGRKKEREVGEFQSIVVLKQLWNPLAKKPFFTQTAEDELEID